MAVDASRIVKELRRFYDFRGKLVIDVGAGGGQLVEYARGARKVVAVDTDAKALARLRQRVGERGATAFEYLRRDVLRVRKRADVVLLEFCLHLMPRPERVLAHACTLAPDVLVIGHAPGSRWSFYAAESDGVTAAWNGVRQRSVRRQADFQAAQRFATYEELEARLAGCGPRSLVRIQEYRWQTDIAIPMPYRIALVA